MNDEERRKYEQEMIEEAARIMEAVNADPELKDVTVPPGVYENIKKEIHKKEAERAKENLSEEDKELLRLGKIYKKKRKKRKYLVLVAAAVLALAFGVTSVGGPEKLFETFKRDFLGREQTGVDSADIMSDHSVNEEEVYEEIEEKFGFYPVRLNKRPEGIEFQEAILVDEVQGIQILFGNDEVLAIEYFIRPNYRTGSMGLDVEDEVLEEYELVVRDTLIAIKKYRVEGLEFYRWKAEFTYQDVYYRIMAVDMAKESFEQILNDLYFF